MKQINSFLRKKQNPRPVEAKQDISFTANY